MSKLTLYYRNKQDPNVPLFIAGNVTQDFIQLEESKMLYGIMNEYSMNKQTYLSSDRHPKEWYHHNNKDIPIDVVLKKNNTIYLDYGHYTFNITGFKTNEEAKEFLFKITDGA